MNTSKQIKKAFKKMDIKINPAKGREICKTMQAVLEITQNQAKGNIDKEITLKLLKIYIPGIKDITEYVDWMKKQGKLCLIHVDSLGLSPEGKKKYFKSLGDSNLKKAASAPKLIKSSPRSSLRASRVKSTGRVSVTNTPRQSLGNPSRRSSVGSIKNEPTIFN